MSLEYQFIVNGLTTKEAVSIMKYADENDIKYERIIFTDHENFEVTYIDIDTIFKLINITNDVPDVPFFCIWI